MRPESAGAEPAVEGAVYRCAACKSHIDSECRNHGRYSISILTGWPTPFERSCIFLASFVAQWMNAYRAWPTGRLLRPGALAAGEDAPAVAWKATRIEDLADPPIHSKRRARGADRS